MTIPKELVLLHLSDLHFGENSRFDSAYIEDTADRFCASLASQLLEREIDCPIGLIVVTGDVTETGMEQEYADASLFFKNIASRLPLDRRRFVFLPGNHDVSWIECQRAELDVKESNLPKEGIRGQIDNRKFQPFEYFVENFKGAKRLELGMPLPKGGFVYDFPELLLSVATLNTCEKESHHVEDHSGFLSQDQAQALMDNWKKTDPPVLRIIALHHNPAPTVPSSVKEWLDFLKTQSGKGRLAQDILDRFAGDVVGFEGKEMLERVAEDTKTSLILHGHHHVNGFTSIPWQRGRKGHTHLISAGSWGLLPDKLPNQQTNSAQIIQLKLDRKELNVWGMVYDPSLRVEGKVTLGSFVSDKSNPRGYRQTLWTPNLTEIKGAANSTQQRNSIEIFDLPTPPRRWRLPPSRQSITHSFEVAGHEGCLTIGLYENGRPGEVFLTMAKSGSTIAGMMETIAILMTQLLQCGYPLREITKRLTHMRFEPSGFTKNPDIPMAKSVIDYVARYLVLTFPGEKENESSLFSEQQQGGPCSNCGNIMYLVKGVPQCYNCGKK